MDDHPRVATRWGARSRVTGSRRRERRSGSGRGWLRRARPSGRPFGRRHLGERPGGRGVQGARRRHHRKLPEALLLAGVAAGALVGAAALGLGRLVVAVAGAVRCRRLHGGMVVGHRVAPVCRTSCLLRNWRMHPRRRGAGRHTRQGDSDKDGERSAGQSHGTNLQTAALTCDFRRLRQVTMRKMGHFSGRMEAGHFSVICRPLGALPAWVGRAPTHRSRRRSSRPAWVSTGPRSAGNRTGIGRRQSASPRAPDARRRGR